MKKIRKDEIIFNRFIYFKSLWGEKLLGKCFGFFWAVLGIFIFVRDEIWMPTDESKWRIINMIPFLPLWWFIGAFIIITIWIFEASFKHASKKEKGIEDIKKEHKKKQNRKIKKLKTLHGEQIGELNKEKEKIKKQLDQLEAEDKYFPRLNLIKLKEYAKRLIDKHAHLPIINIILYHGTSNAENTSIKYAIVIMFNSNVRTDNMLMEDVNKLKLQSAFLNNEIWCIDATFEEIYKAEPQVDFLCEWKLVPIISDEQMPPDVMINEKNVILYPITQGA